MQFGSHVDAQVHFQCIFNFERLVFNIWNTNHLVDTTLDLNNIEKEKGIDKLMFLAV